MKKIQMWFQLLKRIKVTGAVAFSSDFLVKKMLNKVNFSKPNVIVELGAGAGSITDMIAKRLNKESVLLVFEIDKKFCKMLRERYPHSNIHIINDSAENIEQHLMKFTGFHKADFIISSLPFTIIDEPVRTNIMKAIRRALKPQSLYIQYGYNKKKYERMLNGFEKVKTSFVLGNLPPAYIFNCKLHTSY